MFPSILEVAVEKDILARVGLIVVPWLRAGQLDFSTRCGMMIVNFLEKEVARF